jgi:predicted transcriptional regulator
MKKPYKHKMTNKDKRCFTIHIIPDLYTRLKVLAAKRGRYMSMEIADALDAHVTAQEKVIADQEQRYRESEGL